MAACQALGTSRDRGTPALGGLRLTEACAGGGGSPCLRPVLGPHAQGALCPALLPSPPSSHHPCCPDSILIGSAWAAAPVRLLLKAQGGPWALLRERLRGDRGVCVREGCRPCEGLAVAQLQCVRDRRQRDDADTGCWCWSRHLGAVTRHCLWPRTSQAPARGTFAISCLSSKWRESCCQQWLCYW